MNSYFIHPTISSEDMESSGADRLSRVPCKTIFQVQVIKINRDMFHEFTTFFHTGLAHILVNMIHDSTPDRFKFEWSFLTAQFASWARQTKTNKDRIRFYGDLRHLALKHNVLDLLPAIRLQPTDVGLAHLATKYATDHYFALSYLRKRIWALSPIVITDNKASDVFPLTKRVLEGITRLREIKHPLGVVLGKDTLAYFNSSLNSNQNYLDLYFILLI